VSFAAITICVAFQRVFIVVSLYFVMTQSGNLWIHLRIHAVFYDMRSISVCNGVRNRLRSGAGWRTNI